MLGRREQECLQKNAHRHGFAGTKLHYLSHILDDVDDALVFIKYQVRLPVIAELNRLARTDLSFIGLQFAGDHVEQRRLAHSIFTNHTNAVSAAESIFEVFDQFAIAKSFTYIFQLDDLAA